jgi:predicted RNA-binding Zn-ribbon protein involved in translation (DUF1610 family)
MPKLYEAECPNCGATLKITENLEKASCEHCRTNFILAKDDTRVRLDGKRIDCPRCGGKGKIRCSGVLVQEINWNLMKFNLFAEGCTGDGKCLVTSHPEKPGVSANYCVRGKCAWCNGTGRYLVRRCEFCGGSGSCSFCGGSGICTLCNGKGIMECKSCRGRGYNIYSGGKLSYTPLR